MDEKQLRTLKDGLAAQYEYINNTDAYPDEDTRERCRATLNDAVDLINRVIGQNIWRH